MLGEDAVEERVVGDVAVVQDAAADSAGSIPSTISPVMAVVQAAPLWIPALWMAVRPVREPLE